MTINAPPAPLPAAQRSLAPDLARGFMLLVIATVHAHMFRFAAGGDYSLSGPLDTAVTAAMALFAENRGYPMFAALFGYGLAQIIRRRTAEGYGPDWVRRLVRRRGRWLIAIGLAHTVLLFFGDIISVYGLIAVVFAGLLAATDRRLLTHAAIWGAAGTLVYALAENVLFGAAGEQEPVANPLLDAVFRVATLPVFWPLMILISLAPFLVGVWAARRKLLEEPERHLPLLRRIAGYGIGLSLLGGVPHALMTTAVWDPEPAVGTLVFWFHLLTGYAGGFGYAALIALIAVRMGSRRGPVATALAATGRRSMTCYLLQSVAWAALVPPYALGIAPSLTDAQAVALGAGVWLATVVLSDLLRRAGFEQGPAEWFLRRMTYRPLRGRTPAAT
ncbi:DUF418 domain-containing protein [Nocardiopsis coralliicola]